MKSNAFTLIEILITLAIFLTLMGMIGNVFFRSSRVTDQSLAVLELYQKAEGINKFLEEDFGSLQPTCAIHIDEEDATVTFMRSALRQPEQDGDFFTMEHWRGHDLEWVRWQWDYQRGSVSRGQTRADTDSKVQHIVQRDISSNRVHENNRKAMPQQRYIYFEGRGPIRSGTTFDGGIKAKQQVFRRLLSVAGNQPSSGHADIRFRNEHAYEHVRTLGVCGDDTVIADIYAVRNPDGKTYNKDRANLLGDADDYPNQVAPLASEIEFFYIQLTKRDGLTEITIADDDDTLDDNSSSNPTIDINGIELSTRDNGQLRKRPAFANVVYLLHDMPHDLPGVTSDNLLQELRDQVLADTSLGSSDIFTDAQNRRQALYELIEQNGFNALIISKSIRLPL